MIAFATAGEKGEAIVGILGDCVVLPSVGFADVIEPDMGVGSLADRVMSSLAGTSTRRPTTVSTTPEADSGDDCRSVDADQEGADGCVGGGDGFDSGSGAGASGSSSDLGSSPGGFGEQTRSGSPISTSMVGGGVGSLVGMSSLCRELGTTSVGMSIVEDSSMGGEGGKGNGVLAGMSFSAGDLASIFTDADRIRSRCSLSS